VTDNAENPIREISIEDIEALKQRMLERSRRAFGPSRISEELLSQVNAEAARRAAEDDSFLVNRWVRLVW